MSARPEPRPGVLQIEAYVPGKSAAAGRGQDPQAVLERDAARALAEGHRGRSGPSTISSSTRTARRPGCARRSRAKYGLDPARIVCGSGSDELLSLITNAYVGPGDEGIFTEHGFLVYRIAILAAGGTPVVAPENGLHGGRGRDPREGDAADQDRLPRQPQQPDRHLPALRRGEAPACRPAVARAPRARRGLCGIRPPQRLRGRARARRHGRERRHDAHLLEDLRPCQPAPRLDGRRRPHVIDAVNRIRGPFNVNGPAMAAGIAAIEDDAHVAKAVAHNEHWLAWLTRGDRGARPRRSRRASATSC